MVILRTVAEMRAWRRAVRRAGGEERVGLVPTMGALHEGHVSLVRAARRGCELVVASVFVNPTQFGVGEDFGRYPRTFEADCEVLGREGVDVVFAPGVEEMYPAGASAVVEVVGVGDRLDGASRPGHFRGGATVVAKLLNIVQPGWAFFGQKDAAQVAVLRAMVRDLNFEVELVVCETVREADGLAMSSRNRYLSAEERGRAVVLSRGLERVSALVAEGECDVAVLRGVLRRELVGVRVEYAEVVDAGTLEPVGCVASGALVAVAGWVGETRLIDNLVLRGVGR